MVRLLPLRFIAPNSADSFRGTYFGYWCESNFIEGQFRADGQFTSSRAYRLKENDNGKKIVLERRPHWFSVSPESANEIEFSSRNIKNHVGSYEKMIVRLGVSVPNLDDVEHFHVVRTAPMILTAFVVSPWSQSAFFKNEQNRLVFLSRLRNQTFPKTLDVGAPGLFVVNSKHQKIDDFLENWHQTVLLIKTMGHAIGCASGLFYFCIFLCQTTPSKGK